VAKRSRKCKGNASHEIAPGSVCWVQSVPSMRSPKGFLIYGGKSYCLGCLGKVLVEVKAKIIELEAAASAYLP
ncbi:MAG: hypothetical protein ACREH5_08000, partial [Candidatus Omnitrophota bacterium]